MGLVANNPPTSIQTMSAEHQALGPLVGIDGPKRTVDAGVTWRISLPKKCSNGFAKINLWHSISNASLLVAVVFHELV
jgi:hypothetical protein